MYGNPTDDAPFVNVQTQGRAGKANCVCMHDQQSVAQIFNAELIFMTTTKKIPTCAEIEAGGGGGGGYNEFFLLRKFRFRLKFLFFFLC